MELLTRQRTEYYLNAALAFLHQESIDWRMEVELWLDEMVFFYKLIQQRKKDTSVSPEDAAAAEKELIALHGDRIERLKRDIVNHEATLGKLLQSASIHEENYREIHRRILNDLLQAREDMRQFKRRIFRSMAP